MVLPPAQLAMPPLETPAAVPLATRCTRLLALVESNPMTRMRALPLAMSQSRRLQHRADIAAVPISRDGPRAMALVVVRDVQPPR
eukprot:12607864-Alexandrium_andersonii.AAC.1